MRSYLPLLFLLLPTMAAPAAEGDGMPSPGDCAMFREGGAGRILKGPVYYVKGPIAEIYRRPHAMGVCPDPGKPPDRYSRADWKLLAEAYPCVADERNAREVEVIRIRMRVDKWDTPWTQSHGHNGWLYRGHFLDTELKEGVMLDIDGTLLLRCDAAP